VWTAMGVALWGWDSSLSRPSYGGFEGAYECGCCGRSNGFVSQRLNRSDCHPK
jgi:hypothetical protein